MHVLVRMTYISDIYMDDSRTIWSMSIPERDHINQHRPKTVRDVLDTCGLKDALLVISHAMRDDTLDRHLTAWALRSVLHVFESDFPTDKRVRMAIDALDNDDADIVDRERMRGLVRLSGGNAARLEPHGPSHMMCYAVLYSTACRSLSIARTIGGPTIEEQELKLRSMI